MRARPCGEGWREGGILPIVGTTLVDSLPPLILQFRSILALRGREVGYETFYLGRDVLAWLGATAGSPPSPQPQQQRGRQSTVPAFATGHRRSDTAIPVSVGQAEARFYAEVDTLMSRGMDRDQATAAVVRQQPQLRANLVTEYNESRGRRAVG